MNLLAPCINSVSKLLSRVLLLLLYFIFVYSMSFTFVPGGISTRMLLSLVGFSLLTLKVCHLYRLHGRIVLNPRYVPIALMTCLVIIVSIVSMILNGTFDLAFIKSSIAAVLVLFAGYAVVEVTRKVYSHVGFRTISNYIIMAVILEVFLALIMFLNPALHAIHSQILTDTLSDARLEQFAGFRLIGFGSNFFRSGVINAFCLILIGWRVRQREGNVFLLILGWFIVVFIGMMMARTTLIGAGLSMMLLAYGSRFWVGKVTGLFRRISRSLLVLILFITGFLVAIPEEFTETMGDAVEYGFEMFVNLQESGSFSTESSDALINSYDIRPDNVKTWIIGDGLMVSDPSDPKSYYMGTDAGIFRTIFHFGLLGLFVFLGLEYTIVRAASEIDGGVNRLCFWVIYILFLTIMIKGMFFIAPLIGIFCLGDVGPKNKNQVFSNKTISSHDK